MSFFNSLSKLFSPFFCILFLSFFVISCSTENEPEEPNTTPADIQGLTVYKNLTGDPNTDALQAHYQDDSTLINIYGTFDSLNEPDVPKTINFQKKGNDTIVNFIFDSFSQKISSSFISVRGEKLPLVIKFSYPEVGSEVMAISLYEYDWASKTGSVFFKTLVNVETNTEQNSIDSFNTSKRKNSSLKMNLSSNEYLDAVVDAVIVVAAGKAIISAIAAVPAITAAAVAAIGVANTVAVAVGIVALTLSAISNDANASELIPSDGPYPTGIPLPNPVPTEEDPSPNLKETECESGGIGFSAYMDQEGSIGIGNISGGEYPYTYYVNGNAQDGQFFINDYPNGTYMVSVKDVNGCISSKLVTLSREDSSYSNGLNLNGNFYPLNYIYIDYNIGVLQDECCPYVRYAHAVIFSPEPIDFNNPNMEYYLEGVLITDQSDSMPSGEYEINIGGLALGKEIYSDFFTFNLGQNDFYLGSIYDVTETESTTNYELKKLGYINLDWNEKQASFRFNFYDEQEQLVEGLVNAEAIEIEIPND